MMALKRSIISVMIVFSLSVFVVSRAIGTIIHDSTVETCYFTVLDDSNSDDTFVWSWSRWLRAFRVIRANRRLARKFRRNPLQLTNQAWSFADRDEKLKALGLKEKQLQSQPDYLYTLHLASFRKLNSLSSFIEQCWLGKHLERRKVYHNTPKRVRLWVSGEMSCKDDPFYSQSVVVQGKRMYRLNYGVYESLRDANADRRVMEHNLGYHLGVLREEPTTTFIERVWLEPVGSEPFSQWEYPNG